MANAVTTQTLLDGPRNLVVLLTGVLDTSNEAKNVKIDVSTYDPAPLKVRVDEVYFSITPTLSVQLNWDATSDVIFLALTGTGEIDACDIGGLQNNAGAGVTGDIELATSGYSAGTVTYTILLKMTKVSF